MENSFTNINWQKVEIYANLTQKNTEAYASDTQQSREDRFLEYLKSTMNKCYKKETRTVDLME